MITSAGTLPQATSTPLIRPKHGAQGDPGDEDHHDRQAGVVDEELAGHERGEAERGADGEVDVAGDDDDRLADGQQQHDRGLSSRSRQPSARRGSRGSDGGDAGPATTRTPSTAISRERTKVADARACWWARRWARPAGCRCSMPSPPRLSCGHRRRTLGLAGRRGGSRHASTFSGVGLLAGELGGDPALVHDQHAVGHAEHLGQLGGDHQDRPGPGRRARTSGGAPRTWCRRRCRGWARR